MQNQMPMMPNENMQPGMMMPGMQGPPPPPPTNDYYLQGPMQ